MGKGKGGSSSQTVTQKADPWSGQQPYLTGGGGTPIYSEVPNPNYRPGGITNPFGGNSAYNTPTIRVQTGTTGGKKGIFPEAERIYRAGIDHDYFPGQTYADFTPEQLQAMDSIAGFAGNNQNTQAALDFNQKLLSGDFMTGGDRWMSSYGNDIRDQVNSIFGAAGATGDDYHAKTVTGALADSAGRFWEQDIQNMIQASQLAPFLSDARFSDYAHLASVGDAKQAMEQKAIDEARMRYDYPINNQWENLARYSASVNGNYGGTTTTEQPYSSGNPLAGLLGGAATGAGIASTIGIGKGLTGTAALGAFAPWLAGGAVLGGLI